MDEIDKFYQMEYADFIDNGIVGLGSKLTHWSLERTPSFGGLKRLSNKNFRILEVGAGNGQHLNFIKQDYFSYEMTDLRPEMLPNQHEKVTVNKNSISADQLPYPDHFFDRVIASCLIAHLNEPQIALSEWKRVVKQGGLITIYVPCEPGLLLRTLRALVTNPKKRKIGISNVALFQYRDHQQTYVRLKAEIHSLTFNVHSRRFPFPFLPWNFNLWAVFTVKL
jgi:phosphatidylethanolamine/phosphatidyl-N-methylethanolamine N-methyltransferase